MCTERRGREREREREIYIYIYMYTYIHTHAHADTYIRLGADDRMRLMLGIGREAAVYLFVALCLKLRLLYWFRVPKNKKNLLLLAGSELAITNHFGSRTSTHISCGLVVQFYPEPQNP